MLKELRLKIIRGKLRKLEYEDKLLELQYEYNKVGSGWYNYFKMKYGKENDRLVAKLRKIYGC